MKFLAIGTTPCTQLQTDVIDDCRLNCLGCNVDDVNRVLQGCLVTGSDHDSEVPAIAGSLFCVQQFTPCSDSDHAQMVNLY